MREEAGAVIDWSQGYSYEEYVAKGYREEQDRQRRVDGRTSFSEAFLSVVRAVKRPVHLIAFAEVYCPDSVVAMPFVKKMTELNDGIHLAVLPREPYVKELEAATGVARIPTFLFLDEEGTVRGKYVELPNELRERIRESDSEEKSMVILEYRRGKHNALIEKDLMACLASF